MTLSFILLVVLGALLVGAIFVFFFLSKPDE